MIGIAPALLNALASTGAPVLDAERLSGIYRCLAQAYNAHPRLYSLGSVLGLVAVGLAVGLLTDRIVHVLRSRRPLEEPAPEDGSP